MAAPLELIELLKNNIISVNEVIAKISDIEKNIESISLTDEQDEINEVIENTKERIDVFFNKSLNVKNTFSKLYHNVVKQRKRKKSNCHLEDVVEPADIINEGPVQIHVNITNANHQNELISQNEELDNETGTENNCTENTVINSDESQSKNDKIEEKTANEHNRNEESDKSQTTTISEDEGNVLKKVATQEKTDQNSQENNETICEEKHIEQENGIDTEKQNVQMGNSNFSLIQ